MVVNRKQPVVAAPPISRTSSSQPVPTKRQPRIANAPVSVAATPQNGHKPNGQKLPLSHVPRKTKLSQSRKKRKRKSFIDYLVLIFLSAFVLYSFYACGPKTFFSTPPHTPRHTLCRALTTYRTHVLEPYIFPPVKHTLSYAHEISEPYIAGVQAQLAPYLRPAQRLLDTVSPHVKFTLRTAKRIWQHTLTPLYTDVLKPYYRSAILPRYTRYIRPTLLLIQYRAEKYFAYYVSNPLRAQINSVLHKLHQFYIFRVDPYVRVARPWISNATYEFAMKLSRIYATHVHPFLLRSWVKVHSNIYFVWRENVSFFIHLIDRVGPILKWLAEQVGVYRRQYVDPHVGRILEQVADPKANGNVKNDDTITPPILTSPSVVPLGDEPHEKSVKDAKSTINLSASEASTTTVASHTIPTHPTETGLSEVVPTEENQVVNDTFPISEAANTVRTTSNAEFQTALSVAEQSADHASTVLHELEKEFEIQHNPIVTSTSIPSSSASSVVVGASASEVPVAVDLPHAVDTNNHPPTSALKHDEDLDDFLRELGVGVQASPTPNESDDIDQIFEEIPDVEIRTEEKRLAETAAKRADIVGRHETWFEKLYAGVKTTGAELVKTLQTLRNDAAEEIRRMGVRPPKEHAAGQDAQKDVRSLVSLEQDGERLIKGLEIYLRKSEGRCGDWKLPNDAHGGGEAKAIKQETASKEKEKFADIISKVENKFSDRVNALRQVIHTWYVDLKDREASEVLSASQVIKDLASRAQEDLAMDYAWLDDVTYLDWQRYHDLVRIHDDFDLTVRQIANGTSTDPEPPSDPVIQALDGLDKELQDIILGFNYALSGMRSRGLQVFSLKPLGNEDDSDGFFVVRDNERRIDDLRDVDLGKVELKKAAGVLPVNSEEKVEKAKESIGILPVPYPQEPEGYTPGLDASKVIIGKDKVQIEQALNGIPLEEHEEL